MIMGFGSNRLCLRSKRLVGIILDSPLLLSLIRVSQINEFRVHPLPYTGSYNTRHVGSLRRITNFEVAGLDSWFVCREALYSKPVENLESSSKSQEENAFMIFFRKDCCMVILFFMVVLIILMSKYSAQRTCSNQDQWRILGIISPC